MLRITFFSIIISFISLNTAWAQKKAETRFHVDGLCGMCKDRIEAALDVKGILFAEWNKETKEVFVVYRPDKITEEELHQLINQAGHDTERSHAPDSVYENIHHCCRYRIEQQEDKQGDHKGHKH